MESLAGRSIEITDQFDGQKYSIDAIYGVEKDILKLEQERARVMRQVAEEEKANAIAAQASADIKKKQLDEAGEAVRALAEFSLFDKKGALLPEFDPKSEAHLNVQWPKFKHFKIKSERKLSLLHWLLAIGLRLKQVLLKR